MRLAIATLAATATLVSGCGVAKTTAKVAMAPVKVVGKTAEVAGKSVYHTGKGVYHTGKFMGEAAFMTGKGVYYVGKGVGTVVYRVGSVPVIVADRALDTTYKVLRITETTIDVGGKAYTLFRDIPRTELDAYIKALKSAKNVAEVVIDVVP